MFYNTWMLGPITRNFDGASIDKPIKKVHIV
jgi:hypothetical protein